MVTTRRSYFAVLTVSVAMALLCALAGSSGAAPGNTTRASVDSTGAQANGSSAVPSVSDDGRYVAFTSQATDLVPGDTNTRNDVFVRDRALGTTERVSVDSSENQANNQSGRTYISSDGRYVVFYSEASNLVPGDTNGQDDVFVRDRALGTTERVSVDGSGNQANGRSFQSFISGDGQHVLINSGASNLVSDDTNYPNGANETFLHHLQTGETERVSVGDAENQANGDSNGGDISSDGRYVTFSSSATNLVTGDTNGVQDAFVRDRRAGTTERISVDGCGNQANNSSDIFGNSSISSDGRYVGFSSSATNLVTGDTNGVQDAFVHERAAAPPIALRLPSSRTGRLAERSHWEPAPRSPSRRR